MSKRFLFVGENPSETAHRNGWTWRDGKLAAKTLFDALHHCKVNPDECGFVNLFGDNPWPDRDKFTSTVQRWAKVRALKAATDAGIKLVALGNKVSDALAIDGVPHVKLRHPAARGAGRAKATYAAHVKQTLEAA